MHLELFTFLCAFAATNAAVLLWSNKKFELSALTEFNDDTLQDLIEQLAHPTVRIYRSSSVTLPELKALLGDYHTAYNPNGVVSTENATDIAGPEDLAQVKPPAGVNILSVLVVPNARFTRELPPKNPSHTSPTDTKDPIVYMGKTSDRTSVLLYSPQPLILRTVAPNSTNLTLGSASMVSVSARSKDQTTELSAKIQMGEDNNNDMVMLQFSFAWSHSYWSLKGVNVSRVLTNFSVAMNIDTPFSVPAHFSYLCGGITRFADAANTAELHIYDMQVQIDARNGIFDDGYDCLDITTAPIWSGLFISGLLGVGLVIALIAISDIRTPDHCDNQMIKRGAIND